MPPVITSLKLIQNALSMLRLSNNETQLLNQNDNAKQQQQQQQKHDHQYNLYNDIQNHHHHNNNNNSNNNGSNNNDFNSNSNAINSTLSVRVLRIGCWQCLCVFVNFHVKIKALFDTLNNFFYIFASMALTICRQ